MCKEVTKLSMAILNGHVGIIRFPVLFMHCLELHSWLTTGTSFYVIYVNSTKHRLCDDTPSSPDPPQPLLAMTTPNP